MSSIPTAPVSCPKCGVQGSGRFCAGCGATLDQARCRACQAPLAPGVQFCGQCGQPAAAGRRPAPSGVPVGKLLPYLVGGGALLAVLVVLFQQESARRPAAAQAATAGPTTPTTTGGDGIPPDISNMTPRERFDRLYNRVMQASESGNMDEASRFMPMALAAYGDLDQVDADARYHAAMLRLHTGDRDGARALADTIEAQSPTHLFGFMIEGALARFARDDAALAVAYRKFDQAYDREMAANRPEYRDHQTAVDRFLAEARGTAPKSP